MKEEITMDDIPKINTLKMTGEIDEKQSGIAVKVDGNDAHIFEVYESEDEKIKNRERIVIVFKDPHPDFGKEFFTKYYGIDKPGWMHWGGGEDMRLERIE